MCNIKWTVFVINDSLIYDLLSGRKFFYKHQKEPTVYMCSRFYDDFYCFHLVHYIFANKQLSFENNRSVNEEKQFFS